MINWGAAVFGRIAVMFALVFTFTACGGGGGGGFIPNSGSDSELFVSLALLDPDGQPTDRVTASAPGTLRVRVTQGSPDGDVIANVVVTLSNDIAVVVPATGTALTNSGGVATFQIEAGADKGAGTLTAEVEGTDANFSGQLSFQVGDSGLTLGYFEIDGSFIENQIFIEPQATLAAGGNALLSVVVLNQEGQRVTTAEEVRFNSGCIAAGQATINPALPLSVNGEASTLYTAAGCSGLDEITASAVGAGSQAFGTLNIASPQANSVDFVSADPTLIVLRGTGGGDRDETSDVIFRVVDGSGSPLQGITVNFELSTTVGGLSLSTPSALSDGEGQVKVTVQAGDVATVVRVIASVDGGNGEIVATVSDQLTVTTGLPDQDSMTLGVAECEGGSGFVVGGGMNINGLCRTITVRLADKFNNPVVNGTAVVFTTEYGAIESTCVTVNGICSVIWRSQSPRFPTLTGTTFVRTIFDSDYSCPSHNGSFGACPDDLGYTRGGRSTILAHAIGEESFVDRNGNGVMDEDEKDLFANLPEASIDHNEDGAHTPALPECIADPMGSPQCIAGNEEEFIDFDADNTYDLNDDPAVYNGLLCPPKGDGLWCSRELVHVRDTTTVILGSNTYDIVMTRSGSVVSRVTRLVTHIAYISDLFNNPPPSGSTVSLETDGNCTVIGESSFTVGNFSSPGAIGIPVLTDTPAVRTDDDDPGTGTVTVTLTPTGGVAYSETFLCDIPINCSATASSPLHPSCPAPSS